MNSILVVATVNRDIKLALTLQRVTPVHLITFLQQ